MLTLAAVIFARDSDRLIISPIKKMIFKIKRIAYDPSLLLSKNQKRETIIIRNQLCCTTIEEQSPEMTLIENTIMKIGILLVLVFGEAGGNIIRDSMSMEGELVLGYQGFKTFAIFCFCDIRNFTDVTEVLQEEIILFVNEIAFIIHRYSYIFLGAANKNIGDAFLLVWKIKEEDPELNAIEAQMKADLSVFCVLKIIANIKKDPLLQKYRESQRLNQRMVGFDIRLGFGVHMGWAIEGAVGSEYKIDPSYLSPHVNIAVKLESLTKLYGVQIILSDAVEGYLSETMRKNLRQIDTIRLNDVNNPVKIFTIDINMSKLFMSNIKTKSRSSTDAKKRKVKQIIRSNMNIAFTLLLKSKAVKSMTEESDDDFYEFFEAALDFYLDGLWTNAKEAFERALMIKPDDKPTLALLYYMKEKNFISPEMWDGCRDLNTIR